MRFFINTIKMKIIWIHYVGNISETNINQNDKKIYIYSQEREILLFYAFENETLTIKQIAICSHETPKGKNYWVFDFIPVVETNNVYDYKIYVKDFVENKIIPRIVNCQNNNICLNDINLDLSSLIG